jgi:hypothetical protein
MLIKEGNLYEFLVLVCLDRLQFKLFFLLQVGVLILPIALHLESGRHFGLVLLHDLLMHKITHFTPDLVLLFV